MEIEYRNKTYDIIGRLPICVDVPYAASVCKVRVLCGSRADWYHWRTLKNGPTKHRVLLAALKARAEALS